MKKEINKQEIINKISLYNKENKNKETHKTSIDLEKKQHDLYSEISEYRGKTFKKFAEEALVEYADKELNKINNIFNAENLNKRKKEPFKYITVDILNLKKELEENVDNLDEEVIEAFDLLSTSLKKWEDLEKKKNSKPSKSSPEKA